MVDAFGRVTPVLLQLQELEIILDCFDGFYLFQGGIGETWVDVVKLSRMVRYG